MRVFRKSHPCIIDETSGLSVIKKATNHRVGVRLFNFQSKLSNNECSTREQSDREREKKEKKKTGKKKQIKSKKIKSNRIKEKKIDGIAWKRVCLVIFNYTDVFNEALTLNAHHCWHLFPLFALSLCVWCR